MKRTVVRKREQLFKAESAEEKILRHIFLRPNEEFSVGDLADLAGVSKSSVSRIVSVLEAAQIIKADRKKMVWRITANIGAWSYTVEKIMFNLNLILKSGIVKDIVDEHRHPKAVVLFGSFRNGEDITTSDIDFAVESDEVSETTLVHPRGVEHLEKAFGRKITVMLFNRKTVDANVFSSIANGIVLYGFLEAKP